MIDNTSLVRIRIMSNSNKVTSSKKKRAKVVYFNKRHYSGISVKRNQKEYDVFDRARQPRLKKAYKKIQEENRIKSQDTSNSRMAQFCSINWKHSVYSAIKLLKQVEADRLLT